MQEVYVTADYEKKGNKNLIACSYAKIAEDLKPGSQILCADGSLVLSVVECYPEKKLVKCKAVNTAAIGCAAPPEANTHHAHMPAASRGARVSATPALVGVFRVRSWNCMSHRTIQLPDRATPLQATHARLVISRAHSHCHMPHRLPASCHPQRLKGHRVAESART